MALRFAGARWLGERRRRRLASGEGASESMDESVTTSQGRAGTAGKARPAVLSLRNVVPRRAFLLLGLLLSVSLVVAGIVAGAWYEAWGAGFAGSGYLRLLGLEQGRMAVWTTSAFLLLAAQLSLVIGWVRSYSLTDFDGRYRAWKRIAISWIVFAVVVGTQAHASLSQALVTQFKFEGIWQKEIFCWLLPIGILVAGVAWMMDGELKTSRTARLLLWSAVVASLAGTVVVLEPVQLQVLTPRLLALLRMGTLLAAAGLLIQALLVFLRHVVHVSPEPAARRRRRKKSRTRRTGLEDEHELDAAADEEAGDDEYAEEDGYDQYEEDEDDEEVEEVEEDDYSYAELEDLNDNTYRVDPSEVSDAFPDQTQLKGLSKREKRRLRKQWREEQRRSR